MAAPTHTGDNFLDRSRMGRVVDRPRHLHAVIDYMLSSWADRSSLDRERVGAFGFSAGAFTVLVAIGGTPQLRLMAEHCVANPASSTVSSSEPVRPA